MAAAARAHLPEPVRQVGQQQLHGCAGLLHGAAQVLGLRAAEGRGLHSVVNRQRTGTRVPWQAAMQGVLTACSMSPAMSVEH